MYAFGALISPSLLLGFGSPAIILAFSRYQLAGFRGHPRSFLLPQLARPCSPHFLHLHGC